MAITKVSFLLVGEHFAISMYFLYKQCLAIHIEERKEETLMRGIANLGFIFVWAEQRREVQALSVYKLFIFLFYFITVLLSSGKWWWRAERNQTTLSVFSEWSAEYIYTYCILQQPIDFLKDFCKSW